MGDLQRDASWPRIRFPQSITTCVGLRLHGVYNFLFAPTYLYLATATHTNHRLESSLKFRGGEGTGGRMPLNH